MSDIDDDVMKVARKTANFVVAGLPLGETVEQADAVVEVGAEFIARAIQAERERCAKVAQDQIEMGIWGLIPDAIRTPNRDDGE